MTRFFVPCLLVSLALLSAVAANAQAPIRQADLDAHAADANAHHAEYTNPDSPCFDNFNRYVNCGNGTVTDAVTRADSSTIRHAAASTRFQRARSVALTMRPGPRFGTVSE